MHLGCVADAEKSARNAKGSHRTAGTVMKSNCCQPNVAWKSKIKGRRRFKRSARLQGKTKPKAVPGAPPSSSQTFPKPPNPHPSPEFGFSTSLSPLLPPYASLAAFHWLYVLLELLHFLPK